jgi:hypothetical protein
MKLTLFAPYGSLSQEAGLFYLLANYLHSVSVEAVQLTCNGTFSLCDRDSESAWRRTFQSCHTCCSDQRQLRNWAGLPEISLSRFVEGEECAKTREWMLGIADDQLLSAQFDDIEPFEICAESFFNRFGVRKPDLTNKMHTQIARRMMVSTVRMALAARRYQSEVRPDLTLMIGGFDYITAAYRYEGQRNNAACSVFRWDNQKRLITISHPAERRAFCCDLLLEGITTMRAECSTWPAELLTVVSEIASFLGIAIEAPRLRAAS